MRSNVVPLRPAQARELLETVGADATLELLQRTHLAVEEQLAAISQSTLIALLAGATPAEREAIVRELEARR
jgi:hypothetical protein